MPSLCVSAVFTVQQLLTYVPSNVSRRISPAARHSHGHESGTPIVKMDKHGSVSPKMVGGAPPLFGIYPMKWSLECDQLFDSC